VFLFIGVLVGSSIGVAGYFFLYVNMVKPQMDEISERLSEVESSVSLLADIQARAGDRLSTAEEALKSIEMLGDKVSALEDSIRGLDGLSKNISRVENSVGSIESDLSEIRIRLLSLQESFSDVYGEQSSEIDSLQEEITSLDNDVSKLLSEVESIVVRLEKDLAYKLLKKKLAEPGEDIDSEITDEVYDELKSSSVEFAQWISLSGSEEVKNVLESVIDSMVPTLVWNNHHIDELKTNKYMVYGITHFPLTIDTGTPSIGEIKVARVSIICMGTFNVDKEKISSIHIHSLSL
jgi:predicted  nucleic acid-binding Zn-ribbon protein